MRKHLHQSGERRNTPPQPDRQFLNPILDIDVPLTRGGAVIRQRLFRPASTCNLLALVAGIGEEAR